MWQNVTAETLMDKDFWIERWQQQQIGFHQAEINQYLQKYWRQVQQQFPDSQVFVPLCGKSKDMLWLREQGHQVLGIEFSQMAVENFFTENSLPFESVELESFSSYKSTDLNLLCGDFFQLDQTMLQHCHLVYDRASIVALPENMRSHYVDHLSHILPAKASILMVTMEYPQVQMQGPPFSVSEQEIRALFADKFDLTLLTEFDIFQENPKFRERGLTSLVEKVYLLQR